MESLRPLHAPPDPLEDLRAQVENTVISTPDRRAFQMHLEEKLALYQAENAFTHGVCGWRRLPRRCCAAADPSR